MGEPANAGDHPAMLAREGVIRYAVKHAPRPRLARGLHWHQRRAHSSVELVNRKRVEYVMTDQTLGTHVPPGEKQAGTDFDRLLHQAHYTPKQLAELLDMPLSFLEQAAFAGRLKAYIVEHDIVSISREDAIAWLRSRM